MDKLERIGSFKQSPIIAGERYKAYIPKPLPPSPPLDLSHLYPLLDKANTAIGRLDGMSMVLPDADLFLYMYTRKEAVLSSQIEGTQTSFSDFLLFENDEAPRAKKDDLTEVSCYVNAMNYGLERLEFFPLSLRLIREIHKILMNNAKGDDKLPGEFRSSQNWIGGSSPGNAHFVPPPPEYLIETLDYFEKFLNQANINMPALIKAALAHVQFETILPFQDGNGRLGRLLITLILRHEGMLIHPLLYLSMYLKLNRQQYYDHLQSIPETGDWESWIEFFLTGVIETAEQGAKTIQTIVALFDEDRAKIRNSGKSTAAVLNIYNYLLDHPVSSTSKIRDKCELSLPTVLRSLITLEAIGIIREITGKERNKIFIYDRYFALLSQGAETL